MTTNDTHFCLTPVPRGNPVPPSQIYTTRASFLRSKLWEIGETIRVRFIGGSFALRKRVETAAREWLNFANLNFAFVDDGQAEIRVAFIEGDGSWSYVGTDCRAIDADEPTMNFGWIDDSSSDEEVRSVVQHEFGHAIGLTHEHQNWRERIHWDREAVITDLSGPPNNWDIETIEHNMFKAYDEDETISSRVDPKSIMMYPIPARWTQDGYFSAGFNSSLSQVDKDMAREVYPR